VSGGRSIVSAIRNDFHASLGVVAMHLYSMLGVSRCLLFLILPFLSDAAVGQCVGWPFGLVMLRMVSVVPNRFRTFFSGWCAVRCRSFAGLEIRQE
jgi:hypothetical protein